MLFAKSESNPRLLAHAVRSPWPAALGNKRDLNYATYINSINNIITSVEYKLIFGDDICFWIIN
jgi:hypothetical protein